MASRDEKKDKQQAPPAPQSADHPDTPAGKAKAISALVTAIFGGTGAVTLGPPSDLPVLTTAITIAVAALMWILAWILYSRSGPRVSERSLRNRRLLTTVIAGIVLVLSVISYVVSRDDRTARYAGERRIVGTELTERGQKLVQEKGYTTESLLMSTKSKARAIWTHASLQRCTVILWSTFCLIVGAFVFPVVALTYAIQPARPAGS